MNLGTGMKPNANMRRNHALWCRVWRLKRPWQNASKRRRR